ncbi:uncharacterized protein LOC127719107 isoform X2 [Mytilus californianus]|uniref:uncharacterized protein LOC127719107 isoform X2 n=1 Tax=Mytilus californianus TaxID=6549 RepID=UPI002247EB7C|nr:uncharacterized protein LOC127719107 isoform X2 [Mytilus californianus]
MNEIPIYQIPDQLNCSGPAPSNSYIPNPKHTPAPQGSRNAPFNGNIPEQKQNPDDVQRTEPDFSRMFYLVRHGNENSNSTTKISSMPVRYSAVPENQIIHKTNLTGLILYNLNVFLLS